MAKFHGIPITNNGYWCNPLVCTYCHEYYDCCECNSDSATYEHCEECVDKGLAPQWDGKYINDKLG